jgi:hypothetical protein
MTFGKTTPDPILEESAASRPGRTLLMG